MAKLFLAVAFCISLGACAHGPTQKKDARQIPQSAFQSSDPKHLTVAVVAINDFHGSLLPRQRKLTTSSGTVLVDSGGAAPLATMLKILNQEMKGNVLIVGAGDDWQGTLESNLVRGATVVDYFNRIGVDTSAIGNHEFDFNIPNMLKRFRESKFPHVSLNIFEKKNGKRPNWNNVVPSKIFEVAGMKIGVIGLATVNTPGTTRYEFVKHLEFRDPVKLVNEESAHLRAKGAQAVLVTAHAGTFCDRKNLNEWKLHSKEDLQGKCEDDEISQLAAGVKKGTLDGIVAGHTHQVIHHWLSDVPTVQDEAYNQHFNVIYYTFDRTTGKLLSDLTRIEGLIPICTQTFVGLHHCDVRRLAPGEAPKLEQAMFHGKPVIPDPEVSAWLKPIQESTEKYRTEVIGNSELALTHFRDREGALGNLVADAIRERAHSDFSLVNSGGTRTSLDAGPVTFDGIFRALPFDNLLNVIRLKGKDVRQLYQFATAGSHGIVSFSGLKIKMVPYDREVPKMDVNGDGKYESWEGNRILDIRMADGKPLEEDKYYTVATYDYLVGGGDDLVWFMKRVPAKDIDRSYADYSRDIVIEYIKRKKIFNTTEHPLVDPKNPRVVFQD